MKLKFAKGVSVISKLSRAYLRSFGLNPENNASEFFECISDLYATEEVQSLKQYEQHLQINRLDHIRSVAYISYLACRKLGLNYREATRGAILHDLFYYDWRDKNSHPRPHGYLHPGIALNNARELCGDKLTRLEANTIKRHMFPLTPIPPRYPEGLIVSMADKYCATWELYLSLAPAGKRLLAALIGNTAERPGLSSAREREAP